MDFNFLIRSNVIVGNGTVRNLHKIIKQYDYSNPLFLVDEGFAKSNLWKIVYKKINSNFNKIKIIYTSGKTEPTYNSLRKNLAESKKTNCDVVIGIGGGSCLDTTKAVAALIKNSGNPINYRGFDKIKKKGIPSICIPTTAGTGSEATYNASFIDEESNIKMGINGNNMFSTLSILDGETTISCPEFASVSAAVDALVHIIEGYSCKNSNEFSDMLAEIGFKYILESIMDLKNKKADINKRLNLLKGTHLAGIVVMNSGSGIASAVSYPLSVYYGVPHGIGGGMFLLYVAKYNYSKKFDKYKYLTRYLKFKKKNTSLSVIKYLQRIFDKLGVPKKLHRFGIHKDDYNKLNIIMKTQQAAFDQNPIKFTIKKDFEKMIKKFL